MEEKKTQEQEKLSYEKLNQMAVELYQTNQRIIQQNEQMRKENEQMRKELENREFNYSSFFLGTLFQVIDHRDAYTEEFVKWCVENIQAALTSFAQSYAEAAKKEEEANKETAPAETNEAR